MTFFHSELSGFEQILLVLIVTLLWNIQHHLSQILKILYKVNRDRLQ